MLELKVTCECGQRYKFEVEPVNGHMPFMVTCPICGNDGTEQANQQLATIATAPPVRAILPSAPPTEPAYVQHSAEPMRAQLATAPARVAAQARIPQPAATAPGSGGTAAVTAGKPPSFGLGFLGAITGALVGALIYYLLFKYTGLKFKLVAVAVGFLAGMSAEWLGRKEGSKELGMIAGALTLAGILGAQYFVTRGWWIEESNSSSGPTVYAEAVTEAKKMVSVIPNGTDEEIRVFIAKEESEPGAEFKPSEISDEEVQEFRTIDLVEAQDLASGKLTKEVYEKTLAKEDGATAEDTEGDFKTFFMLFVLSKLNLVSMAAAAGLAFKLCTNA